MAYPTQLAGARSQAALVAALVQLVDTAVLMDRRVRAIQHAYAGVTAADYEANGAAAGAGATYAQMNLDLATFVGSPAWVRMLAYVDELCDIGR